MLPNDIRLDHAESIALDRLVAIARDSESEHEARMAATAIFSIRRHLMDTARSTAAAPMVNPPPPSPRARPARPSPLTAVELAELALHLPTVKPQRFLNKHTPAYWREVLERHRQSAAPCPQQVSTGPPTPIARAA